MTKRNSAQEVLCCRHCGKQFLWLMDYIRHEAQCGGAGALTFSEEELAQAVGLLVEELHRAVCLHPTWKRDPIHAAALISEEAGELVQAANDFYDSGSRSEWEHMRQEAAHTGAMVLRFLLALKQWKGIQAEGGAYGNQ